MAFEMRISPENPFFHQKLRVFHENIDQNKLPILIYLIHDRIKGEKTQFSWDNWENMSKSEESIWLLKGLMDFKTIGMPYDFSSEHLKFWYTNLALAFGIPKIHRKI
jgi:hypothetical protein